MAEETNSKSRNKLYSNRNRLALKMKKISAKPRPPAIILGTDLDYPTAMTDLPSPVETTADIFRPIDNIIKRRA